MNFFYYIPTITLFIAILFDLFSYYFRSTLHENRAYQTVISSGILYISRIFNVLTLSISSYFIETNAINFSFSKVFLLAYILVFLYILIILIFVKQDILFNIIIKFIKLFYNIKCNDIYLKIHMINSWRIVFSSFMVSYLVFIAILTPLLSALVFFNMRMTVTYTSSIFNFIASGILLGYLEPVFALRSMTAINNKLALNDIIIGKFISIILAIITCIAIIIII